MTFKRHLCLMGAVAFALPLSAETADSTASTNATPWTLHRFQREFCGEDSWEPFNRTMFGIFDVGMTYVVDPFCYLYSSIIPKPLIKGVDNFGENLESPCRICSNLFMGEWLTAWDATRRVFINSTLGVGGLFDPAQNWFYIFQSNASLSDTFAAWGIPAGPTLALPFMPRTSLRGHVGFVADYAFDLKTWFDIFVPSDFFLGYSWCLTPNKAPVWRGHWESVFGHAADRYATYMPLAAAMNEFNLRQFAWHYYEDQFNRSYARLKAKELPEGPEREACEAQAETLFNDVRPPVRKSAPKPDGLKGEWREIPGFAPRSPALDSMRALCFSPLGDDDFWWERRSVFNRDFSKSIEERDIVIRDDLPKATYSYVAQAGGRPTRRLVIVLPGIGAGRTASEAVAMAEFLHAYDYGVVICDSLFHWEHMRSVNRGILPGNIVEDAYRFGDYLGRILDDLQGSGLTDNPEASIIGWSMGGLTVAHLAALDVRRRLPVRFDRFIAINPPASMEHALAPFDPIIEKSRGWSKAEAHDLFVRAAPSLYGWAAQDHPRYDPTDPPLDTIGDPWDYAPNLTDDHAVYLMGMLLHGAFTSLIMYRHDIEPFPWLRHRATWFSRRELADEIGTVMMRDYINRYVPSCYDGIAAQTLIDTADISRLESELRQHAHFSVIHTWNDPLETDDDRRWFDDVFGKRITWFADGAHCGYFYTRPFQDELLRRLSQ